MNALPHHNKQKGAVLVLVTVALFVLLGFTALALDGGYLLLNKTRVQDAVDSAALSGAKTLAKMPANGNTHDDARAAVYTTLQTIFTGDGFNQVDIDINNIAAATTIEFSHKAVPFVVTNDSAARYIRVRLNTVPVNQFFSQLMVDNWQVASAAVAGPEKGGKPQEQQVIPLLLCSKDTDDPHHGFNPSDKDNRGDVIVIKTNHHDNVPVGPGNTLSVALNLDGPQAGCNGADDTSGADKGASKYLAALAGDISSSSVVEKGQLICTEPGIMTGPTHEGLNTRFGIDKQGKKYAGPADSPENSPNGAYYSDCSLPSFSPVTFDDVNFGDEKSSSAGNQVLTDSAKLSQLQSFPDYASGFNSIEPDWTNHCVPKRRIVKLPVADCKATKSKGRTDLEVIDTVCMFLNQEVTGKGASKNEGQYIVAEMLESCDLGSGGSGSNNTSERLVLYKDTASGDS